MKPTVKIFSDYEPYMTVMVPMFRAKYIGWLSLESLRRQKPYAPPWELIIAEEQNDETFGLDKIEYYLRTLRKLHCAKFTYIPLNSWVPLADKIKLMINYSSKFSEVFIFHAADYYSNDERLYETYAAFVEKDIYWLVPPCIYEFNLKAPEHILLVNKMKSKRQDDTPGKAIRADLVREAVKHIEKRSSSVDGLIYQSCVKILGDKMQITVNPSESWHRNLSVEGLGTISNKPISKLFRNPDKWSGPYSASPKRLENIVPRSVANNIWRMRKFLKKHNGSRPHVKS